MLYHHTDAAGLAGIVGTKRLWATRSEFLNDPAELTVLNSAFFDAVKEVPKTDPFRVEVLDRVAAIRETDAFFQKVQQYHLASFAANGDDLDLWRAYGANGCGYSIGFKTDYLTSLGHVIRRVNYGQTVARDTVERLFAHFRVVFRDDSDADCALRVRSAIGMALVAGAPFFKSARYEREREWRMIVPSHIEPLTRVRGMLLVPTCEVKLRHEPQERAIGEVLCGPATPSGFAEKGVSSLLSNHLFTGASVRHVGSYYHPTR